MAPDSATTNNCPSGVASQKEALRKRFTACRIMLVNFSCMWPRQVSPVAPSLWVSPALQDLNPAATDCSAAPGG